MARTYVQVSPDSTGKKVATDEIADGADTVERQIVRVAGVAAAELQDVRNSAPGVNDYGGVVRTVGGVNVFGSVAPIVYDYLTLTQASTTDTFVYKNGGAGGATVATILVTYVDSTKAVIASVART